MMNVYEIKELSPEQKDILKASVPILKDSGVTLTQKFYQRMLDNNPVVRPFFNVTDQKLLRQPKILAFALLKYAENIDDLSPLHDFVHQIVVKHVGLQVQPEHYPIVGSNLLATMQELLGDLATEEFMNAWATAYGNLAQLLINAEHSSYEKNEWQGFRSFAVSRIVKESSDVKSVYFRPIDEKPIMIPKRGQYICIRWNIPGYDHEISREYSLSEFPQDNEYRISVRLLDNGLVSGFIHNQLKVGDKVRIAPPSGQFVYDDSDESKTVLILAGGIGITPLISILDEALDKGRKVSLLYSNKEMETRPFKTWFQEKKDKYGDQFTLVEFFSREKGERGDHRIDQVHLRRIEASDLKDFASDVEIYLLGPRPYMHCLRNELNTIFKNPQIRSEFFGPLEVE